MRVLVACEYSGTIRDAFRAKGHFAMSCDLLPTERDGLHWRGDVSEILNMGWDLMICHPPCTYLSISGMHWTTRGMRDPKLTEEDWFLRIALGMQLGGSLGNLIDRITIGHVTDFISVGNFPVFNIRFIKTINPLGIFD